MGYFWIGLAVGVVCGVVVDILIARWWERCAERQWLERSEEEEWFEGAFQDGE